MKIISTNTAEPVTFTWMNEEVTTGIYKKPTNERLFLTKEDVAKDEISDRLNHGGYYKACYVYPADDYAYWKELYPGLDWTWGMFGENLTLSDFDENEVKVGVIYKVGEALVQVAQYREPCYKLGHKFGTQKMIKQFVQHGIGGTYFSVLEEGHVQVGDEFVLIETPENTLSVAELFQLRFAKERDEHQLKIAATCKFISHKERAIFQNLLDEI